MGFIDDPHAPAAELASQYIVPKAAILRLERLFGIKPFPRSRIISQPKEAVGALADGGIWRDMLTAFGALSGWGHEEI
jgi:hypothetical protein